MASVRITRELRSKINENARDAYNNVNVVPKPTSKQCEFIAKAVKNTPIQCLLKDVVTEREKRGELYPQLGENLMLEKYNDSFPQFHKTSVVSIVNDLDGSGDSRERVDFNFNTPIHLYSCSSYTSHRHSHNSWNHGSWMVSEFALEQQTEVAEMVNDLRFDIKQFWENKKAYEKQIEEVLKQCTTVKQLLDVWPAAESLVPSEKLQEMAVKITRKQRAQNIKEEIHFDSSKLNKHLLANKLLGAAK